MKVSPHLGRCSIILSCHKHLLLLLRVTTTAYARVDILVLRHSLKRACD